MEEWADAHTKTLNKLWNEVTSKVKAKGDINVSTQKLIDVLETHLKETSKKPRKVAITNSSWNV